MIKLVTSQRKMDGFGSGAFKSPRGSRKHKGIDYAAWPGSLVLSLVAGKVTKLGYPYADNLSFRYVEVTTRLNRRWRFFYVSPSVEVGDTIKINDLLGSVQDLEPRYRGITPHIHLEVMLPDNRVVNPEEAIGEESE